MHRRHVGRGWGCGGGRAPFPLNGGHDRGPVTRGLAKGPLTLITAAPRPFLARPPPPPSGPSPCPRSAGLGGGGAQGLQAPPPRAPAGGTAPAQHSPAVHSRVRAPLQWTRTHVHTHKRRCAAGATQALVIVSSVS